MGDIDKCTELPLWWPNATAIAEAIQEPMEYAALVEMVLEDSSTITNLAACYLHLRGLLEEVHSALDDALGDSDLDDFESEDEMRDYAPAQWAAMKIAQALHREEGDRS